MSSDAKSKACPFAYFGCNWTGPEPGKHVSACDYGSVKCKWCELCAPLVTVREHELVCDSRRAACADCKSGSYTPAEMKTHAALTCAEGVVGCESKCNWSGKRKGLDLHRKTCGYTKVKCSYYTCKVWLPRNELRARELGPVHVDPKEAELKAGTLFHSEVRLVSQTAAKNTSTGLTFAMERLKQMFYNQWDAAKDCKVVEWKLENSANGVPFYTPRKWTDPSKKCSRCKGTLQWYYQSDRDGADDERWMPCQDCENTGLFFGFFCYHKTA